MIENFKFGNLTDVGLVRKANEDYYGCFDTPNGYVFVVCDGMGGHVGGAIASQAAVEAIKEYYHAAVYDNIIVSMQNALVAANNAILQKIQESPDLEGMGTTAVLLIVKNDSVYYAHVGDSRIYYIHKSNLYRITKDHSFVQALVDGGNLTEEEAEMHPKKNQITKALGISLNPDATICNEPLKPVDGDYFLLCSDGLTGMVKDNLLTSVMNRKGDDLQQKVTDLVELAKKNGGTDNITAQLIQFTKTSNLVSNYRIPAGTRNNVESTGSSATSITRFLPLLAIPLLIAVAFYGYQILWPKDTKVVNASKDTQKVTVTPITCKDTPALPVGQEMTEEEVEEETYKYDDARTVRATPDMPRLTAKASVTSNKQGLSTVIYPYTIMAGDDTIKMAKVFRRTWAKIRKDDPSYKERIPLKGRQINIRVQAVLDSEGEDLNAFLIQNSANFGLKPKDLIVLEKLQKVLVP